MLLHSAARFLQREMPMAPSPVPKLPPLLLVLGKGGVGRTTTTAALGLVHAERGERTLIVQWAVADAISPWFDRPRAGHEAAQIAPNLWTMNFSLDATLREYFVGHLRLELLYRTVVSSRHVQRATHAVPGLAELLFLGRLMWLTTLAKSETGSSYDRVVVDMPAFGHGISILSVPRSFEAMGLAGLMTGELKRVSALLGDPARSAAVVVTTGEELAIEETLELWPRLERELGRAPIVCILNRAVDSTLGALPSDPEPWYEHLEGSLETPAARGGLRSIYSALARRVERERAFRDKVPPTPLGLGCVAEGLLSGTLTPLSVLHVATRALAPLFVPIETQSCHT